MTRLDVRPEAELDILEAAAWCSGERAGLGEEFLGEIQATFARIEDGLLQFPLVFREIRRAILHRFPFGVFFVCKEHTATVLAITHLHRQASAWQLRH